MGRRLRYYPPFAMVAVTDHIIDGQYFLLPKRERQKAVNALIAGAIAKARQKYGVQVLSLLVMGDHWHLELRGAEDSRSIPRFMQMIKSLVARGINRMLDRRGPVWDDRYHAIHVLDEETLVGQRLPYTLLNPVRAGLCEKVEQYPGLSSAAHLLGLQTVCPPNLDLFDLPPSWQDLDPDALAIKQRHLLASIRRQERTFREDRARRRLTRANIERSIEALNPTDCASQLPQSRLPICFAATSAVASAFRASYRLLVEAYRAASDTFLAGILESVFPAWTFPPGLPYPPVVAQA